MPSSIVRKAVVPVAGFGTSFLPETKTMPKAMLPIVDIPAIQFVIEEITKSGIEEILLISGHAKRAVEDHFDSSPELEDQLFQSGKTALFGRNPRYLQSEFSLHPPKAAARPR